MQQVDKKLLPIPDSQFTIDCDFVVPAIGQSPLAQLIQDLRGVECAVEESWPTLLPERLQIRATLPAGIA